ncbi:hypothetical protein L9F63_002720, partial [Diploptera punctata]
SLSRPYETYLHVLEIILFANWHMWESYYAPFFEVSPLSRKFLTSTVNWVILQILLLYCFSLIAEVKVCKNKFAVFNDRQEILDMDKNYCIMDHCELGMIYELIPCHHVYFRFTS